jgi:hypothetical protein
MRPAAVVSFAVLSALGLAATVASGPLGEKRIRVTLEVRESTTEEADALGAGGVVVLDGRRSAAGGLGASSTEKRRRRSTGLFTIVQDGGESVLTVASRLPYRRAVVLRDYALGLGYVDSTVAFEDVGTSLRVAADVLGDDRVHLRLTPRVSYVSDRGRGVVDFTEATTDVVVRSGERLSLGGSTSRETSSTARLLGLGREESTGETSLVVTATIE